MWWSTSAWNAARPVWRNGGNGAPGKHPQDKVKIALVGKYTELPDSYLSVIEALKHAGIHHQAEVEIDLIFSGDLEEPEQAAEVLSRYHGIIVPSGFGSRGIQGMITAIRYAREKKKPFFGISLGFQIALVEYGRNVLGLDAGSEEAHPGCKDAVVHYARKDTCHGDSFFDKNGTMRLGSCPTLYVYLFVAAKAYGKLEIRERHRHRLEMNNAYRQAFEEGGLTLSGINEEDQLVDVIELKDHPWFLGCSFQPEFKSRPNRAHPLFREFIGAALQEKNHQK